MEMLAQIKQRQSSESKDSLSNKKNVQWKTEMKLRLVEIDHEERENGRGFMSGGGIWNFQHNYTIIEAQRLRDNATRFKKKRYLIEWLSEPIVGENWISAEQLEIMIKIKMKVQLGWFRSRSVKWDKKC